MRTPPKPSPPLFFQYILIIIFQAFLTAPYSKGQELSAAKAILE